MRALCLFFAALLVVACAGSTRGPEAVLPPGVVLENGVYYIPLDGVEVNGRNGFRLDPGWYRFATDQPGHRLEVHEVEIGNRDPRRIQVEPGPGFAVAGFTFTPEADSVTVASVASPGAPDLSLDPPWRIELDAGRYRVEARAEGQLALARDFAVAANEPVSLDLRFTPRPTSAPLRITTTPAGAELFVDGAAVGEAPHRLDALEFGTHRISAYVYADSDKRVAFEDEVVFGEESPDLLELTLRVEQRRFEGAWYERAEAERLLAARTLRERLAEEEAYRSARANDPVEVQIPLPGLTDKRSVTLAEFSRALFVLLRVGDRARVDLAGTQHLVWKRSVRADAAFQEQVEALWNNQPLALDYAEDPARVIPVEPEVEPTPSLISAVAYRLYRRLNDRPILDLGAAMHDLPGISVHTIAAEGATTVLTLGGAGVALDGRNVASSGELGFGRLAAGDRTLELTWDEAPELVLMVSERNPAAQPALASRELNLNQKRLVELGVEGRVHSFHRFTALPDGTWRFVTKERVDGLPLPMDLDSDEVGPHETSGQYRREWLIDYETADGRLATRQVMVDYTVGEVAHPVRSPEFIRRRRPSR